MDFELPSENDPRRRVVRAWCEAHPNPTGMELAKAGYVVPHWPKPWGLDAEPELQLIIDDELKRAGISRPNNPVAINNCGISLVLHGTKEQQDRYLWPALSGEETWCQLFSEPSSGSDLASLRTQAVLHGDHYLINGSKIWTSLAHKAAVGIMVARTNPAERKHRGLSTFIIDMHAPGVEVRPIDDMTGFPNEYNQCFFTDVHVPVGNRVGGEGDGWRISNAQLQTERVALAKPGAIWGTGPSARELVAGLHDAGALTDPLVRQQAAELYIEGEVLRLLKYRNLSDRMQERPLGPESAVQKALSAPHGQRIMAMALEWMGPRGLLQRAEPFENQTKEDGLSEELAGWNWGIWFSPAVTLGIGTTEVMKNVIAERLLEMPREDDPDVRKPWNETLKKGRIMNFAFNEDQDRLRDSAVRFLRDRIDLGRLTAQGNRPNTTYDEALWNEIVALGWTGLIIPEEYGGLGMSLVDWVVITEELGRSLAPCPYLGNYAGTLALLRAGSAEQKETLLPQIVAGSVQAALAWSESEQAEDPLAVTTVMRNGRLHGTKRYVVDADTATHLVVTARDAAGSLGLYLVDCSRGVSIEPAAWMDITRRVSTVTFADAAAEPMPVAFDAAWSWITDRILLALSSENAGGAESILRQTVAYANQRIQFGKPIASYQAIKHKCADMMMKVESAKALTYYCAWALAEGANEGPLAASMAKSFTSDAYRFCTSEAIQIHGAIGFTWEMTVHLYFKRARANAVMFGNPAAHRERVIQLVTAA